MAELLLALQFLLAAIFFAVSSNSQDEKLGDGGGPGDTGPAGSAWRPAPTDSGFTCSALGCGKSAGRCAHVDGCS